MTIALEARNEEGPPKKKNYSLFEILSARAVIPAPPLHRRTNADLDDDFPLVQYHRSRIKVCKYYFCEFIDEILML